MTAIFVDTNILVYPYDRSDPVKQQRAYEVVHRLAITGTGIISTQVMAEFFNVTTRKLKALLTVEAAHERLHNYLQIWEVVNMTPIIVLEAVRGVQAHQFSFWDALIWATAKLNQIEVLFSEDFRTGSVVEGVRIVNPLQPDFDLDAWISIG
jgi:predicted nucleic acid-binding protein